MGRVKPRRARTRRRRSTRQPDKPDPHAYQTTTHRQAIFLVVFGLAVAAAGLALLEVSLRVAGYGGDHTDVTAWQGFNRTRPLFRLAEDGSGRNVYATDPDRLTFFNYQEFPADKEPGTFRIFCFGGSSTYGRPYRWETAFPRWMELILNSSESRYRFEVVNVGGISYASYRVIGLVEEVLDSDYQPDLLVVYTGHNEFLEKWTCEPLNMQSRIRTYLGRFRLTALLRAALRTSRPSARPAEDRFVLDTEVDAILDRAAGLDYYVRDDKRHRDIVSRYEQTLERMVGIARSRDVPLVFVNMVSNLKDFSPFKSSHADGLTPAGKARWDSLYALGCERMNAGEIVAALSLLREASEIDCRHADLQFRIAGCFGAVGETALAESCYMLARDEDVCPLRAPREINDAIRRVCDKHQVPLVDLLSHLRKISHRRTGSHILGNGFFLDHIHLTIEGNQIMALAIVENLAREGLADIGQLPDSSSLQLVFREVEASLDSDYMARMHLNLGKVLSWAGKKEEAAHHLALAARMGGVDAETYYRVGKAHREAGRVEQALIEFRKALAVKPDYAAVHNDLGLCYLTLGRLDQAEECFGKAIELRPDQPMPHIGVGRCYAGRGLLDRAIAQYEKAVTLQPDYADGLNNLGVAYQEAGRLDDAEGAFERALALYPDFAEARNNLGLLYLGTGRRDMAEAEFRAAMRSKPHLHQTYGNLGLVLLLQGDRAGAAAMFNKVLELNPGDPDAIRLLAGLE
jgi:tetratricopeptide (TPR) repeat protein